MQMLLLLPLLYERPRLVVLSLVELAELVVATHDELVVDVRIPLHCLLFVV